MFEYIGAISLNFELVAITGLRIGGSKESFEIGGLDNPVIKLETGIENFYGEGKHLPPETPYIPGSSLKGKIRHLLEWALGRVTERIKNLDSGESETKKEEKAKSKVDLAGQPCDCGRCEVCKIFGVGKAETLTKLNLHELPGPPRAIFYDLYLTYESLQKLIDTFGEGIYTEIKTENQINRLTARANPRKIERVPAGTAFKGTIVFNFYRRDDVELFPVLIRGMKFLEKNYLGGYGTRGSGRVKFRNFQLIWEDTSTLIGSGKAEIISVETADELLEKYEKELMHKIRGTK